MTVAGRTVMLAGATSPSGLAIARALVAADARVIAVGRDQDRLDALADALGAERAGSVRVERCSLTDEGAVTALAGRLAADGEHLDGLVPLVGGWRGGGGLAGQSEDDYRALESSFTAIRLTSRAFEADLRASAAGRFAILSSTAVARPLAGGANYAAVKAASEAWTRAVAQGFAKAAREADEPLRAAATVLRVKALDSVIDRVATTIVGLWDADAVAVNDRILDVD
ncbi:SDR family oxidoreductase [uncultured Microbacterium sp.]|uniref:SDR family NAD(P)-dependent oxidoreductase n=1 Tax=uncultured Microbacterium sp. TaxID=191216 RepID=UPI0025E0F291|nr:SDR family NAD(P)-dependent oxidoreductase [uncultured Microbacterium sp.]